METRRQISGPIRFAAILTLLFACVLQPSAQEAKETSPPSLPFFEWNRCPFEGCVYRKWKAEAPVQLYTTWKKSRHRIGTLPKGETVLAQTGVVITFKPGLVRMERDAPPQSAGEPIRRPATQFSPTRIRAKASSRRGRRATSSNRWTSRLLFGRTVQGVRTNVSRSMLIWDRPSGGPRCGCGADRSLGC